MRTVLYRARSSLIGMAVLGALGFGASAALAAPRPCPLTAIGSCGNLTKCREACAARGGDPAGATCTNGCCFCPGAGL
ncbi:MAG TPA: hypothetical protein VFQ45_06895 [Longimicrobium sp.]|nr:hypothetical protein [Longimicrobium sp.]